MLNLKPGSNAVAVTITGVRVMALPEPIRVHLTVTDADGAETALEPLRTGPVLPGAAGPSTWSEALLSELTALCGIDPAGLDVRHLPRLLQGEPVRIFTIRAAGGETVLVGVAPPSSTSKEPNQ